MPVPCEPVWGCVYTGAARTLCCQTTAGSFILAFAKWEVSFRSGIKAFLNGEPGVCGKVVTAGALILVLISDRSPNPISILPGSGLSELGALQHSPACGAEDRQGLVCEPELWWVLHEPPQLWGNRGEDAHVKHCFCLSYSNFGCSAVWCWCCSGVLRCCSSLPGVRALGSVSKPQAFLGLGVFSSPGRGGRVSWGWCGALRAGSIPLLLALLSLGLLWARKPSAHTND